MHGTWSHEAPEPWSPVGRDVERGTLDKGSKLQNASGTRERARPIN